MSSTSHEASEPGPAAVEVTVVRGEETYPLTARVTEWELRPHPQVPERGDAVHFTYRAVQEGLLPEASVELAACAVDSADVVLLCDIIAVERAEPGDARVADGDSWLGPVSESDLSDTARVLFLPDQLKPDLHAGDPKDSDGYVPPAIPGPGDRLRTS
ncbi:hypothetical protein [Streptomyces sp. S.PNR 29]|uniref:hypothetical protein n=1 Tax=Streptomyces sp. S.PNR 29 TaxID=2973805 RepID=UPI0025B183C8|nr:hypothetical protein [Streptomyces sp. S.PNR 29]MDN0196963.1 hypothetical protein [Streptomyces sp. S.PNR 29]